MWQRQTLLRKHNLNKRQVIKWMIKVAAIQYAVEAHWSDTIKIRVLWLVGTGLHAPRTLSYIWADVDNAPTSSGCVGQSTLYLDSTSDISPNNQYRWRTTLSINASIPFLYCPHPSIHPPTWLSVCVKTFLSMRLVSDFVFLLPAGMWCMRLFFITAPV